MSDYVQTNNFTAKDELPAGAAEKKILGAEWDEEFNAISTAIATKYDSTDVADQTAAEGGVSDTTLLSALGVAYKLLSLGGKHGAFLANASVDDRFTIGSLSTVSAAVEGWTFAAEAGALYFFMARSFLFASTGSVAFKLGSTGTLVAAAALFGDFTLDTDASAIVAPDTDMTVDATNLDRPTFAGFVQTGTAGDVSIYARSIVGTVQMSVRSLFAIRVA